MGWGLPHIKNPFSGVKVNLDWGGMPSVSKPAPVAANPTQQALDALSAMTASGQSDGGIQLNPAQLAVHDQALNTSKALGKYQGRQVIDDADYDAMAGYMDQDQLKTLRAQYIKKSEKSLVDKYPELIHTAAFKPTPDPAKSPYDPAGMGLIMQMVLGPYLQQTGDAFNQRRAGIQDTQKQLLKQMSPEYQPYLEAMMNQQTLNSDQSWQNTLTGIQNSSMVSQFVDALTRQAAAREAEAKNAGKSGGGIKVDANGNIVAG